MRRTPDPPGLWRRCNFARPLRPRTQTPPRPTPQASSADSVPPEPWVSGAISAPTKLQPRAQSTPPSSLSLGAKLPIHGGRTLDMMRAMPPTLQQGMSATIPTTPDTVAPYLFNCGALHDSKRGLGKINPYHCNHALAVTILLLQDTLQSLRPNLHDSNRVRRRAIGVTMPATTPQG
jgi:hypothetical protein